MRGILGESRGNSHESRTREDHVLRGHESSQVLRSLRYTSKEKEERVKGKERKKK